MFKRVRKIFIMLCTVILIGSTIGIMPVSAGEVSDANAVIVNDWAYVRKDNGDIIQGKRVNVGDRVRVVGINYDEQLTYVQYPTAKGVDGGWIKNCSIIKYFYQGQYHNGSTREPVYSDPYWKNQIGSLDPYEYATPLYRYESYK
ncbi:MAG: hypothetical protein E7214_12345 [Clostridium sp.]|nr:hypothetical protein [Clostridium sp.]